MNKIILVVILIVAFIAPTFSEDVLSEKFFIFGILKELDASSQNDYEILCQIKKNDRIFSFFPVPIASFSNLDIKQNEDSKDQVIAKISVENSGLKSISAYERIILVRINAETNDFSFLGIVKLFGGEFVSNELLFSKSLFSK